MMNRITDMRGDLQPVSSGWLFKSPLAGGGGIVWRHRLHSLLLNKRHINSIPSVAVYVSPLHNRKPNHTLTLTLLYVIRVITTKI